jgi:hypothetical protein
MVEVAVAGDDCRLVLRVSAYEFPDAVDVNDANWLIGEVEMKAGHSGSFTASHRVTLRADEMAQFRDELVPLVKSLKGAATLRHLEEQVGCTVTLDEGTGNLTAFIGEHVGSELRIRDCKTDQSYLAQTVHDLNALLSEFPARGRRG